MKCKNQKRFLRRPCLYSLNKNLKSLKKKHEGFSKVCTVLKEIIKKAEITCLFVTHDREDAEDIADTIIEIEKGILNHNELVISTTQGPTHRPKLTQENNLIK